MPAIGNGTWIDIDSLPTSWGTRQLFKKVLAPSVNLFGPSGNAEGIYVIDCEGRNLVIENVRVMGTLVILNPGSTCRFQGSMSLCPVSPHYPAVLVQGNAQFTMSQLDLDEALLATNFNPTGVPYNGTADADTADKYPSKIKGLVYVSGQMRLPPASVEPFFDGSVICNTFQADSTGDVKFSYRPTHLHYPPPGFAVGSTMQIVPGTWTRSALP